MAIMLQESGSNQLAPSVSFSPMLGAGDAVSAGGGGGGAAAPFDIAGTKVVRCGLVFGRTWLECADTEVGALESEPSGVIYATVTHDGRAPSLSVSHGSSLPENGLDVTHRGLYAARNGEWVDIRSAITIVAMD